MSTLKTCFFDSAGISGGPCCGFTSFSVPLILSMFCLESCVRVDLFDYMFQYSCRNKHDFYPPQVRVFFPPMSVISWF